MIMNDHLLLVVGGVGLMYNLEVRRVERKRERKRERERERDEGS